MGGCLSKKDTPISPPISSSNTEQHMEDVKKEKREDNKKIPPLIQIVQVVEEKVEKQKKTTSVDEEEKKKQHVAREEEEEEEDHRECKRMVVRTSSCSKEEVDAILIQCGRLSRSSSGKDNKHSGSKRSYDFDNEIITSSSSRRTPSRDRDRERDRDGGAKRVSRSPGRRSETPSDKEKQQPSRPAKMVSVPARDKTIQVKRAPPTKRRTTASPRSRSPANNTRPSSNDNTKPSSLSRSSSKKGQHSPCRRNPLNEIDDNTLKPEQPALKYQDQCNKTKSASNNNNKKLNRNVSRTQISGERNSRVVETDDNDEYRGSGCGSREQLVRCSRAKEEATPEIKKPAEDNVEEGKGPQGPPVPVESLNPQPIKRSRSSRRSRDLDLNPDTLLNPTSYASSLLDDIHNYHHQHNTTTTTPFSLPSCLSKACSILEAVADLNSSTTSNLSSDKSSEADRTNSSNNNNNISLNALLGRIRLGAAEDPPLVESEVIVDDDLMEPSLHKYVPSMKDLGGETEQQESAGSNSFIGHHWGASSSSWEPNSVDSTSRWTSYDDVVDKEDEMSPVDGHQQHALSFEVGGGRRLRVGNSSNNSGTHGHIGQQKGRIRNPLSSV